MKLLWLFLLLFLNGIAHSQNIPIERLTNWSNAGIPNLDTANYLEISAFDLVESPQFIQGLHLYNSTEQLILAEKNIGTRFSVPGNELKSGAYYLQVETQFGCSFVRVIKID